MRFFMLAAVAALAACATNAPTQSAGRNASTETAPRQTQILSAAGAPIGQATFTEATGGVLIKLELNAGALPGGWHGLHLHGAGTCADNAAGFTASGAHVGHGGPQHGLLNSNGPEAGDLPNIFAPASGAFAAEVFTPYVTLANGASGARMPLLDADGSALIIHANADDQQTQPIGGAGPRIACAALTP